MNSRFRWCLTTSSTVAFILAIFLTALPTLAISTIDADLRVQGSTIATDDFIKISATNAQGAGTFTGTITNSTNDLTAARTWKLPNADGTFAVSATGPITLSANGNIDCVTCLTNGGAGSFSSLTASGTTTTNGDVTLGDAAADGIIMTGEIRGSVPFIFEGSTNNDIYTFFTITEPTISNKTITFPNITGTVVTSGDTDTVTSTMILDNNLTASDLSATLAFADGDLLNLSAVNNSSTSEGLLLPQATDCNSGTAEGQICWDTDSDTLLIGNGTTTNTFIASGGAGSFATLTTTGNVTLGDAAADNLTLNGATLTLASTSGTTITTPSTQNLTIDTGTTGTITLGTSGSAKSVSIGSTTTDSSIVIQSGTGDVNITSTDDINVGTNAVAQNITIGNSTSGTNVVINAGTAATNGITFASHVKSTSPSIGSAPGNGGGFTSNSASGTDTRGSITTTVAGTTTGTLSIPFGSSYGTAPICVISAGNLAAAVDLVKAFVTSSTTAITLNFNLATGGTEVFNYHCIE